MITLTSCIFGKRFGEIHDRERERERERERGREILLGFTLSKMKYTDLLTSLDHQLEETKCILIEH